MTRCDDDHGEFFFSNGAVAHFFFANDAANKTLPDALVPHGAPDFSHYDAVVANEGNEPPIEVDSVLEAAFELRDLGVRAVDVDAGLCLLNTRSPRCSVTPHSQTLMRARQSGSRVVLGWWSTEVAIKPWLESEHL